MKYISIDLETTGLNAEVHDIIEFGAVLDDLKNPLPLDQLPKFHTYIYKNNYIGEPYALSMHSQIFRRIDAREEPYTYMSPESLGKMFKKFLLKNGYQTKKDKISINVAGKNFASFDLFFLKKVPNFSKHVTIRQRIIDPAILFFNLQEDEKMPDLSTCLKRANLESEVKHTAIEDALDVIKLLRKHYL